MSRREIDADDFAKSIEEITGGLRHGVEDRLPGAVYKGVKKGAVEWRRRARALFDDHTYFKHGHWYESGKYARSVRSHMTDKSGRTPSGEAGVPSMPGLPHLLEHGHARVGGGRVRGFEHIAPAAEVAFDVAQEAVEEAIGEAMGDA